MSTPPGIEPAELADRISEMMNGLRRAMRSGRVVDGVAPRHEAVLAWLRRRSRLTTAELARNERITPQSMGATVAELVEKGWIAKTRDAADGRRELLALTDAGAAVILHIDAQRRADLVDLLATRLSDADREQVARALDVMRKIDAEPGR